MDFKIQSLGLAASLALRPRGLLPAAPAIALTRFSWDLKTLPDEAQELVLTYWGEYRGRQFDILVDRKKLAAEHLTASHPGVYFDKAYPLPATLTNGKEKVTLRIQGANTWVGGVFGVRVMKAAENR